MSEDHHLALPVGHLLGKYKIDSVLGSGGFAITYLAIDAELKRRVAIKELLPAELAFRLPDFSVAARSPADKESLLWARERFLDEARTIARFEHPNLVHVHEHLEMNETAYIVMGCVEGSDLNDHLKGIVPVPMDTILQIIDPMLGALAIMHESGFLHRDIKPDNIRVTPEGSPVLIDFGSARHAVGARTKDLTTILTPRYAPFEQYSERGNLGPWTDIYSLAAVIHKMLRGGSPPEAPERERADPYQPLAGDPSFNDYPQTFLAAIDKALKPHESERPQNTVAWRELLWAEIDLPTGFTRVPSGRHFADEPTAHSTPAHHKATNPTTTPTSVTKSAKKSKSFLIVGLALTALGILAFGSYTILEKLENDQSEEDSSEKAVAALLPEPVPTPDPEPNPDKDSTQQDTPKPKPKPEPEVIPEPIPIPPPEPPPVVNNGKTAKEAQMQFRNGDSIFFDIRVAIASRNSSSDRLDGNNKGLISPPYSKEEVRILETAIASKDRDISTLSNRSLEVFEELNSYPKELRKEGYELRTQELTLRNLEEEMDTRLQQSLLNVFYELTELRAAETRLNEATIEAKVGQVSIPD